jgi:hypothetical protein
MLRPIKDDEKGPGGHLIAAPHATVRHCNYALRRGDSGAGAMNAPDTMP